MRQRSVVYKDEAVLSEACLVELLVGVGRLDPRAWERAALTATAVTDLGIPVFWVTTYPNP